jgi:hypothetical protein
MAPQFTRYESSAHANVECVACHIGPGASFFIKSKIDGMKQVYAVLTDSYEKPIKSPVQDLRPARETCETCHSPTSFKDNKIKTIKHYDNDIANTPIKTTLILRMGGWEESTGISQGIHWHINNEVYYVAADEQRQVILWVGVKQPDGSIKEYFARDMLNMAKSSFVEEAKENGEYRLMDCIDCHNRAAHYIPNPQEAVDKAIDVGAISSQIPSIRSKAIEVLTPAYTSENAAYTSIEGLIEYYQSSLVGGGTSSEEIISTNPSSDEIDLALAEIKAIYSGTNFPDMGLNWQTNPNNESHTPTMGCFRCHDDNHVRVSESGELLETLSVECNLCHTVPIVGRGDEILVETPVIVGDLPTSHSDFSWTIAHREVKEDEINDCYACHGQSFCNNGACHNLSHPEDMLFTHAEEYRLQGDQVCYTCHQNVLCARCHPGGIVENP